MELRKISGARGNHDVAKAMRRNRSRYEASIQVMIYQKKIYAASVYGLAASRRNRRDNTRSEAVLQWIAGQPSDNGSGK